MQPELFYLTIIPKKLSIHKSMIYQVHPLTRYQLHLIRNAQLYQSTKGWTYAGNHKGIVQFTENSKMQLLVDASVRTNFFTLKLMQVEHSLLSSDGVLNKVQKQEILGKHNLFIKKYLSKFTQENIHVFEENSHITQNFTLHYKVFIQRTPQGRQRIVEENERLNIENRPRRVSAPESVKSSTFSDKINEIQVKGQNRFAQKAHVFMQANFGGSQSKLSPQIQSLNLKNKIRRSGGNDINNKSGTHRQNMFKPKNILQNQPNTERKMKDSDDKENDEFNNTKQQNREQILSPPVESIKLKKLSSQEVKINFDLNSPDKLKRRKITLQQCLSHQQRKRKLLEQFERKRIAFKRRIDSQRLLATQNLDDQQTEFELKRSNSMRSMKSIRSFRLIELQRLPEEKPWVKKQKEKTKKFQTRIMHILIVLLCILLFIVMKPNKNQEFSEDRLITRWQSAYAEANKQRPQNKPKQKKTFKDSNKKK